MLKSEQYATQEVGIAKKISVTGLMCCTIICYKVYLNPNNDPRRSILGIADVFNPVPIFETVINSHYPQLFGRRHSTWRMGIFKIPLDMTITIAAITVGIGGITAFTTLLDLDENLSKIVTI